MVLLCRVTGDDSRGAAVAAAAAMPPPSGSPVHSASNTPRHSDGPNSASRLRSHSHSSAAAPGSVRWVYRAALQALVFAQHPDIFLVCYGAFTLTHTVLAGLSCMHAATCLCG
jgi:hypothetical protein